MRKLRYKHFYTIFNIRDNLMSLKLVRYPFYKKKKIYHFHLMKTGGTSLNDGIISSHYKDTMNWHSDMYKYPDCRIITDKKIFVSFNYLLIHLGLFHYGFSHRPYHQTRLPKGTYSITCIRDPLLRNYSRYKHIKKNINEKNFQAHTASELNAAEGSFGNYLELISDREMCNQLYFYSNNGNVCEAIDNLSKVNFILRNECFAEDINVLNKKIGLEIPIRRIRETKSIHTYNELVEIFNQFHSRIEPEMEFHKKALELIENR